MKKLSQIVLIGISALLTSSLTKADDSRYYLGTAVLISRDNFIVTKGNSLMQRFYDSKNKNLTEKVTVFDAEEIGVSSYTQNRHVDSVIYSNKQHVTYSTVLPADGKRVSVIDVEVIEGLFSEYRIYDKKGDFINAFFRWGAEITKSEYEEKLAKIKWNRGLNLRSPANQTWEK